MNIHVCKQCGARFVYCRACVFRPVRYKENGFCSKECYEASKINVVEAEQVQLTEETIGINTIAETEVPTDEMTTIKNETNTYKKKKNKYRVHE